MSLKKNLPFYGRFKGTSWFEPISESTIMICGQGGVGSWLTLFLARTGANLVTVDYDTVEDHNIAGQLYGKDDVGKKKVVATVDVIQRLCGEVNITALDSKIQEGVDESAFDMLPYCDVVCTSFDNIRIRRIMFEAWLERGKEDSLFVDGRMSLEQGNVFTVDKNKPEEVKHYRESCFDDRELPEAGCTVKATSHCGSLIASLMTSQITNWFHNKVITTGFERAIVKQLNFNLPLAMFDEIIPKPIEIEVCQVI